MLKKEFAIVDWGTSSFRLWVTASDGVVRSTYSEQAGMSVLKRNQFQPVLEHALEEVGADKTMPVVICGMAGAAQGWAETPYVDLPASPENLANRAIRVDGCDRSVFIVPGLAQRSAGAPDVMRGEETLLLGAMLSDGIQGLVCLPGTHSKWASIEGHRITRFETAMTGEVFALLSKQSTLSHFLVPDTSSIAEQPAFAKAVQEALEQPHRILQLLFSVRATPLLQGRELAKNMSARLSGLLVGLEIAGRSIAHGTEVTLISNGEIARVYEKALAIAGLSICCLDAEKVVRAGLLHCANIILADEHLKNRVSA